MKRSINLRMCLIGIVATLLTATLVTASFYKLNTERLWSQLEDMTKIFASNVNDLVTLDKMSGGINNHYRVTLIDTDGTVLFDSRVKTSELENHNKREEVINAKQYGIAKATRMSDSVQKRTYYYAMKVDHNRVLRLAAETDTVRTTMLSIVPLILLVSGFAALLCFVISTRLTKGLLRPIEAMAKGEVELPYEELKPFAISLKERTALEKMKQEFTANVSHELKTPLTSISGYAELMESGMVKDEDIKEFAGKIHSESKRLMVLIGDIMKLSELEEPGAVCQFEMFSFLEVIQECVASLELSAKKHRVTMHVDGKEIGLFGDRKMVGEIVYNLCDNAIRYNREGGNVYISLSQIDDRVFFSVQDTGIGIPEKSIDAVFQRFYRVDKSRSKETGGTGLGLAIVKHIAELHDAKIKLESKVDKGTKITLIFKAAGMSS